MFRLIDLIGCCIEVNVYLITVISSQYWSRLQEQHLSLTRPHTVLLLANCFHMWTNCDNRMYYTLCIKFMKLLVLFYCDGMQNSQFEQYLVSFYWVSLTVICGSVVCFRNPGCNLGSSSNTGSVLYSSMISYVYSAVWFIHTGFR